MTAPSELLEVLEQALRTTGRAVAPGTDEVALGALLLSRWEEARAQWPDVELSCREFVAHLAAALTDAVTLETLGELHTGDLYLACACLREEPAGLRAFEAAFIAQLPRLLSGAVPAQGSIEEIQQQLRERFFVRSNGQPPRIAAYSGRGPLLGWVRIAAIRTAISLHRGERAREGVPLDEDRPPTDPSPPIDPERELLRRKYQPEVESALKRAMGALSHRERNLLRLHFIEGVTLPKLGELYGAGRSTVARWLANARARVLAEIRGELVERLRLSPTELDSLLVLVQSRIDLSLREQLAQRSG